MTEDFPKLSILPQPQRQLWSELNQLPANLVLYGGTAVALQLGHRESMDFDFFSHLPLDAGRLMPALPFLAGATITQREPNTLTCLVSRGGPVKVSFFGVPQLPRLLPPLVSQDNGLRVASLLDLAGLKATVVQLRAEAKDYLDLDALFQDGRIDLPLALGAARALYAEQFNPQITLKALSYFEDGTLRLLPQTTRDRLARAAREVDLDRLPQVSVWRAGAAG